MGCQRALIMLLSTSLIFTVIFWVVSSADNPERDGYISIDCGVNEDYYDKDTDIFYKTDADFIDTGINMNISPASGKNLPLQIKNLRIFREGSKNCYTLMPKKGKNNTYLIRASFRYGNHDGKNVDPVFDLYLGVNFWDTVKVRDSSNSYVFYEAVYVPSTDYIDVCLVNTNSGIPFISALELRAMDDSIYPIASGAALSTYYRYNVAGSNNYRYKDDPYDRIWTQFEANPSNGWYPINTTSNIESSGDAYYPPQEVLKTAARAANSSRCLRFSWSPASNQTVFYVYSHFAEIEELGDGQMRMLKISINDEYPDSEPIKLEYLKALTKGFPDWPIKGNRIEVRVCAATNSTFAPILNGIEVFELVLLPNLPTNNDDVYAMKTIKKVYGVTRNWQGDPCIPSVFSWSGLSCSNDKSPRIISL